MIENLWDPSFPLCNDSERIVANYNLLLERLNGVANPNQIWRGVRRLQIISVSLNPVEDNPQAIFESMNSTGKDLAASDLVRNYVLMGLPVDVQNRLYNNYWRVIEKALSPDEDAFDGFLHDYLTLLNAPTVINPKDTYATFKRMCVSQSIDDPEEIEALLAEMVRYAKMWSAIAFATDSNEKRRAVLAKLGRLDVTVARPLIMAFYDTFAAGEIDDAGLLELLEATESYLLRRAVCGWAPNSLGKFFPSLIARLRERPDGAPYAGSLYAMIEQEARTARRFPDDVEFAEQLRSRNMYAFRKCLFLLNELENSNHTKNPSDFFTGSYSIEHVMPQNALAHEEWVEALGGEELAADAHASHVHTLGNLTVTAFNSELSDGTFEEKRERAIGGFKKDGITLSADIADKEFWNAETIEARGYELAKKALKVWKKPAVDMELVAALSRKKAADDVVIKSESFANLITRGAIAPGDRLVHSGTGGNIAAVVTDEGTIRLENGEEYNSTSMAAIRAVALLGGMGNTRNGWKYWSLERDGVRILLNDLRLDVAAQSKKNGLSETQLMRMKFWNGFYEYASDLQDFNDVFGDFAERQPNKDSWCSLRLGKPDYHLDACVYFDLSVRSVSVDAYFSNPEAYVPFFEQKAECDQIIGELDPHWDDLECDKKSRKVYAEYVVDTRNEELWQDTYEWIVAAVWKFKKAFGG